MSGGMPGLHHTAGATRRGRAGFVSCVLIAALLVLLPAAAGADSRRRPYRPTGRDRSLAAADALGGVFFSERQRRAAQARRAAATTPVPVSSAERTAEDWLSRWGEVDSRETD